jgi:hypothetical protein
MIALQASNRPLSGDELCCIRDILEASAGKETKARWHQLEKRLAATQYDGLIDDDGKKPKEAFDEVKAWRELKPRTLRRAISAYGKRRRKRRRA